MTEVKTGIFDRLYAAGKEAIDAAKKPLIKNALKRKLRSAYDDATKKSIDAEVRLSKAHENFSDYDVNKVLEARQEIQTASEIQACIKTEWLELFGTEMKNEED